MSDQLRVLAVDEEVAIVGRAKNRDIPMGMRSQAMIDHILQTNERAYMENGVCIIPMDALLGVRRDASEDKAFHIERLSNLSSGRTAARTESIPLTDEEQALFDSEVSELYGSADPGKLAPLDSSMFGADLDLEVLKEAYGDNSFSDGLPTYRTPAPMPESYAQLLAEQNANSTVVLSWKGKPKGPILLTEDLIQDSLDADAAWEKELAGLAESEG